MKQRADNWLLRDTEEMEAKELEQMGNGEFKIPV